MPSLKKTNSRNNLSRFTAGVSMLGLAACSVVLGLRYTKTAQQDNAILTKSGPELCYEHSRLLAARNTSNASGISRNEAKIIFSSSRLYQHIGYLILQSAAELKYNEPEHSTSESIVTFDMAQHILESRTRRERRKVITDVVDTTCLSFCPDNLRNFLKLAHGEFLDRDLKYKAIYAAQVAFRAMLALNWDTQQGNSNEIVSGLKSLSKATTISPKTVVLGGILFGARYAVGFDMESETDADLLSTITTSSVLPNADALAKEQLEKLISDIRGIELPQEYLSAVADTKGTLPMKTDSPDLRTLKKPDYVEAIRKLLTVLEKFQELSSHENDLISQDRPAGLSLQPDVEIWFIKSHPKLRDQVFETARKKRELYRKHEISATDGVFFENPEGCNKYLRELKPLMQELTDAAVKITKDIKHVGGKALGCKSAAH